MPQLTNLTPSHIGLTPHSSMSPLHPQSFHNGFAPITLTATALVTFMQGISTSYIPLSISQAYDATPPSRTLIPITLMIWALIEICAQKRWRHRLMTIRIQQHVHEIQTAPDHQQQMLYNNFLNALRHCREMINTAQETAKGSPGLLWFMECFLLGTALPNAYYSTVHPFFLTICLLNTTHVWSLATQAKQTLFCQHQLKELADQLHPSEDSPAP